MDTARFSALSSALCAACLAVSRSARASVFVDVLTRVRRGDDAVSSARAVCSRTRSGAWPLRRLVPSLPLAPLIIGTFFRDFEYWLRLAPSRRLAHSAAGLLVFCVPVSLLIWTVFRRIVCPGLLRLVRCRYYQTARPFLPAHRRAAISPPAEEDGIVLCGPDVLVCGTVPDRQYLTS